MPLIIIIVSIFCLIGMTCLVFPKLFIVPEDDEMATREGMLVIRYWLFGGGGIATLIVRAVFGVFPEFIQKAVVRLVGLGIIGVSIYVGSLLTTAIYPNGYWNSASRQKPKNSAEYTTEVHDEDVTEGPGLVETVNRQTGHVQKQEQSVPTLEEAEKHLASASELWRQGKAAESLKQAEAAWQIRKHHLGSDHPKTKEVEKMIQAAQGGQ